MRSLVGGGSPFGLGGGELCFFGGASSGFGSEFFGRRTRIEFDALGAQSGLCGFVTTIAAEGVFVAFDRFIEAACFFVQLGREEERVDVIRAENQQRLDLVEGFGDLALLGVDAPQQQAPLGGFRKGLDALLAHDHRLHVAAKLEVGVREGNEGLGIGGKGHLELGKILLRGVAHDRSTVLVRS